MSGHAPIVVVGGGVVGVSCAFSLAERGAEVTLLERGEICSGASYGNAGWIFPSHSTPLPGPGAIRQGLSWLGDPESPFYIRPRASPALAAWLWRFRAACNEPAMRRTFRLNRELSLASQARYAELARLAGLEFGYAQRGILLACRSDRALGEIEAELRLLRDLGGSGDLLDAAALRERVPALAEDVTGGAWLPADAHVTPDRFVRGLAAEAERRGVRVLCGMEVMELERTGRRVTRVLATRGELSCDELVIAGGAWTPGLVRPLGLRVPVEAAKGYSITVRRPVGFGDTPLMLAEAKVGITPLDDRLRFAGTLELAGLDLAINARRVAAIRRAARDWLPGLAETERIETWRGLRPLTPDDLPVIGRPREIDNLVLATGHGMSGMAQGPITGELVAQLLCGEATALDLTPFSPDRF